MRSLGVGEGFLQWTSLLLSATSSQALVNGSISTPHSFAAGVRQGCPLAPLLYLFIGIALLRYLKSRGIGVLVAGLRLTAAQFADDIEAFLSDMPQVHTFLDAMDVFGQASGQRRHPAKTRLLPVGSVPPTLPSPPGGLQLAESATALGITFHSGVAPATVDWAPRLAKVRRSHTRLARLRLSTFGRGFGSAAYGVSQLLYDAEFIGPPPPPLLTSLQADIAKLVERGLPPASTRRAFAGVRGPLLIGSPCDGGFGVLPLAEHIRARQAGWLVRLAREGPTRPWVAVAMALFRTVAPNMTPLRVLFWRPVPADRLRLAPPLIQLLDSVHSLPPPTDIAAESLTPGPWCMAAPLWYNPLLRGPSGGGLEVDFPTLASSPINSIALLLTTYATISTQSTLPSILPQFPPTTGLASSLPILSTLIHCLPPAWLHHTNAAFALHAQGQLPVFPTPAAALELITARFGWPGAAAGLAYTVKHGTTLQLAGGPAQQARTQRFQEYEAAAWGGGTPDGAAVRTALRLLWPIPWDNTHKDVFLSPCLRRPPHVPAPPFPPSLLLWSFRP